MCIIIIIFLYKDLLRKDLDQQESVTTRLQQR